MSNTCTRCGQAVSWVKTAKTGRRMPIDREPTPAGNVVLIVPGRLAVVLADADRDLAVERGEVVWRAHFANCPYYERTRR